MKLIEKLSKQYTGTFAMRFVSTRTNEEAYKAGFRKAREMALENIYECRLDPHLFKDPLDCLAATHEIVSARSQTAHAIKQLGESEVDESECGAV